MKEIILFLVFVSIIVSGCKKDVNESSSGISSRTEFEPSVSYRVFMTKASPADSARGIFKDSVIASRKFSRSDPDFYSNVKDVGAYASYLVPGFSVGYDDDNKFLP